MNCVDNLDQDNTVQLYIRRWIIIDLHVTDKILEHSMDK